MFYIDSSKCSGCGMCADTCPQRAITIYNDLAVINQGLCQQCGTCARICPVGAIYEVAPVYAQLGKGGDNMRGRGWFGWGWPGGGRGNPYSFCRFYPWPPRRWWTAPYAGQYAATTPYRGYGSPGYGAYYPVYMPYRLW